MLYLRKQLFCVYVFVAWGITKGAHKDLDSHENRKTPVQPESTDRRPKQNQGEPEKKHQRLEEQGGDGLTGEDQNRAIYMHKAPESYCRHVAEPDMTKIKVRRKITVHVLNVKYTSFLFQCFNRSQSYTLF